MAESGPSAFGAQIEIPALRSDLRQATGTDPLRTFANQRCLNFQLRSAAGLSSMSTCGSSPFGQITSSSSPRKSI